MKSVIGALRVNLGLDSAAFEKGVKSAMGATKSLEKNLQGFATRSADLGKKLSLATAAMGAAAGAGLALAKSTASAAKEMDTQAKLANSSRGEFQRWAAGSKTVGIEQDKLSDILKDVNDRVGDFIQTGGGPMADFFENIAPKVGVTADQFARLSGPEALQLYVSSLEKAGVSQQDMTFYMEAMASDATALIPLLQNGGAAMEALGDRAERAGAVMSDSAVDSALMFQSALDGLVLAADGLRDRLGAAIIPLMTSLVEAIASNVVPAIQGMIGHIEDAVKWFSDLSDPVQNATLALTGIAAVAGPALVALGVTVSALGLAIGALTSPIGLAVLALAGLAAGVAAAIAGWDHLFLNKGEWRNASAELAAAIDDEVSKLSDLNALMPAGATMSKEMAVAKLNEAKAYRESIQAKIDEARQAALAQTNYGEIVETIAQLTQKQKDYADALRQNADAGDVAIAQAKEAANTVQIALDREIIRRDEILAKIEDGIGATDEQTAAIARADMMIQALQQSVNAADGGLVTMMTHSQGLAALLGNAARMAAALAAQLNAATGGLAAVGSRLLQMSETANAAVSATKGFGIIAMNSLSPLASSLAEAGRNMWSMAQEAATAKPPVLALVQLVLGVHQLLPAQDLSGPGAMKGGTEHADEQTVGDEQAPLHQILASLDTQ